MNEKRSVWRETKFIHLILTTNALDIDDVLRNYYSIAAHLTVEKRKKKRDLQMIRI
jgi:hypothetical protein